MQACKLAEAGANHEVVKLKFRLTRPGWNIAVTDSLGLPPEGDHNDIVKQFQALHGTLYCGGSL